MQKVISSLMLLMSISLSTTFSALGASAESKVSPAAQELVNLEGLMEAWMGICHLLDGDLYMGTGDGDTDSVKSCRQKAATEVAPQYKTVLKYVQKTPAVVKQYKLYTPPGPLS